MNEGMSLFKVFCKEILNMDLDSEYFQVSVIVCHEKLNCVDWKWVLKMIKIYLYLQKFPKIRLKFVHTKSFQF